MSDNEDYVQEHGGLPDAGGGGKPAPKKAPTKKLAVEKIYQQKDLLEHILLRPEIYIGSVEPTTKNMWVLNSELDAMVQREITYAPGLYRIFDNILVNAADNNQRDPKMDCIKIVIDQENNTISVWNNGRGIPVVEHKDEKMFVPTMIFGHFLTSSNFNDEEKKLTSGRNGCGAKLCNIFSSKFTVETSSSEYKKCFKQTWRNNMAKASIPETQPITGKDFTKVTFTPDLTKFKMEKLDEGIISLMERRAYEIAATTQRVKVFLNGTRLPINSFKDYVEFYRKGRENDQVEVVYEVANPCWEVAMTISDECFQQISFVNGIATEGGTHVDHVTDAIVEQLMQSIEKKNKDGFQIKPFEVKRYMWIFVNCLIVNPIFDSPTKERMTLQVKDFGSKCTLTEKFIPSVFKSGITEVVLTWAKLTQPQKTSSGKKQNKLKAKKKRKRREVALRVATTTLSWETLTMIWLLD